MNYIPDLGSFIWFLGLLGGSALILYGLPHIDQEWKLCDREWFWMLWLVACLAGSVGFWGLVAYAGPLYKACLLNLAIYLVVCFVMDSMLCKVNNFMQYFGILGGIICALYNQPEPEVGFSLIFFALIQYVVFLKMYGGADGMSFLICALYLAGMGKGIESYLFHMLLCYVLLAVVQAIQGNITKEGKLVEPVPLLPYISLSFLIMVQPYAGLLG